MYTLVFADPEVRWHEFCSRSDMEPHVGEAERRDTAGREFLAACLRREFQQMPGVALTIEQVSRLFNVPLDTCHRVLAALAVEGKIEAREDGRFAGRRAAAQIIPRDNLGPG